MTEQQLNKLDKCHFYFHLDQNCEEEIVEARSLLGGARFDLYAILLYIDHYVHAVQDLTFAKSVYKERTCAITGYKFAEDGNPNKQSFEDYITTLNALIDDFHNDIFDESKSLIPVDKDYVLVDGAHRVACAAYFGRKIRILRFPDLNITHMSSSVLSKNLLPASVCDTIALEACKWHDNLFMLFLWPKSFCDMGIHSQAIELIYGKTSVVYEKETVLTYQAIRNLMIQIYGHMDWVGTVDNDFASTYAKADEVWEQSGKCRILLVQAPSTEYVLETKKQIRDLFNIGLASMHSTDNMRETLIAANALLNANSVHFLSNAQPCKFKKSYKLFETFKTRIEEYSLHKESFIIDSSMILAMFGLRQADDLDYYVIKDASYKTEFGEGISNIEEHDEHQKAFYNCPIEDLVYNVSNYFVFNEIKFVSLEKLLEFKNNRFKQHHDAKDAADIKIITYLLNEHSNKRAIRSEMRRASYIRRKRVLLREYKNMRNSILQRLGIYEFLKSLKNKL